jgi:hypothetical protein
MFDIYNEHATFVGTEKLSPFDFDTFSVCMSNVVEADSIRVGINIKYEQTKSFANFQLSSLISRKKNQNMT